MRQRTQARIPFWVVATVAAALCLLALGAAWQLRLFVPSWVTWQEEQLGADLDADGSPGRIVVAQRSLTVRDEAGQTLYVSDPHWQVAQALCSDVDGNGTPEVVALVWRRGNYGTSHPFWDQGLDLRMTEHLYVFTMRNGEVVPLWMGHELGAPVERVEAAGPGVLLLTTTDGRTATWTWDYFGFTISEDSQ